jgi:hypothetical protein
MRRSCWGDVCDTIPQRRGLVTIGFTGAGSISLPTTSPSALCDRTLNRGRSAIQRSISSRNQATLFGPRLTHAGNWPSRIRRQGCTRLSGTSCLSSASRIKRLTKSRVKGRVKNHYRLCVSKATIDVIQRPWMGKHRRERKSIRRSFFVPVASMLLGQRRHSEVGGMVNRPSRIEPSTSYDTSRLRSVAVMVLGNVVGVARE